MTLRMRTDTLLTFLATRPIYARTEDQQQVATDICHTLLNHIPIVQDESEQVGMIGIVYLVAEVMQLEKILNDELISLCLFSESGSLAEVFPPQTIKMISELAHDDFQHYIQWISPFLLKAGVSDIESELKEIDAIQDVLYKVVA